MYAYKIGYNSPESSEYIELCHEKEFSQESLENFFILAVLDILIRDKPEWMKHLDMTQGDIDNFHFPETREYLEKKLKRVVNDDEIKKMMNSDLKFLEEIEKEKHIHPYFTAYYDIHDKVCDIFIKKWGFTKVKYDAEIVVSGWGGIVGPCRHFGEDDKILDKIKDNYWKQIKEEKKL